MKAKTGHSKTLKAGLTLLIFLTLSGVAQSQVFTVSGTVTNLSAIPQDSVEVRRFNATGDTAIGGFPIFTNALGQYSISGFPAGTYQFKFIPVNNQSKLLQKLITGVSVSANLTLDVSLSSGHLISGFVRDTTGVGIFGIDLKVTDSNGDPVNTPHDNSDATGFYAIVLPTGEYDIKYRTVANVFYPENYLFIEFRRVLITADTVINVTLPVAATILGTVTGPGVTPVFNADLDAQDSFTGVKLTTPGDNTDIFGAFSFQVPAGIYDINVEPLFGDKLTSAIVFDVLAIDSTVINFTLENGILINGQVKNTLGVPVVNVDIDVTDTTSGVKVFTPQDKTDISGNFSFYVSSGNYDFDFQPPINLLNDTLAPISFPAVPITTDTTMNVTVPNGIVLSGLIQNSVGVPVSGVDIDAKEALSGIGIPLVGDNTDLSGAFLTVLAPGNYNIEIEPPQSRRLAALLIPSLSLFSDTTILVALDTGMQVTGVVSDTNGSPIQNVTLLAVNSGTGDTAFIPRNKTNITGVYIANLALGTYDLLYKPDSVSGITDSGFFAGVVISKDTVINVSIGSTPAPTFTISGTVTDSFLVPVENVAISLLKAGIPVSIPPTATDIAGLYSVSGILPGTYDVHFMPQPADGLFPGIVTEVVLIDNTTVDIKLALCGISCSCCVIPGDSDGGGDVNVGDAVFTVKYIFQGGMPPLCCDQADADGGGDANIGDATWIVKFVFQSGAPPICPNPGGLVCP